MVVRRQLVGARGLLRYVGCCGGGLVDEGWVEGGSMDVIFRREGSVLTRLFSGGLRDVEVGLRVVLLGF